MPRPITTADQLPFDPARAQPELSLLDPLLEGTLALYTVRASVIGAAWPSTTLPAPEAPVRTMRELAGSSSSAVGQVWFWASSGVPRTTSPLASSMRQGAWNWNTSGLHSMTRSAVWRLLTSGASA